MRPDVDAVQNCMCGKNLVDIRDRTEGSVFKLACMWLVFIDYISVAFLMPNFGFTRGASRRCPLKRQRGWKGEIVRHLFGLGFANNDNVVFTQGTSLCLESDVLVSGNAVMIMCGIKLGCLEAGITQDLGDSDRNIFKPS